MLAKKRSTSYEQEILKITLRTNLQHCLWLEYRDPVCLTGQYCAASDGHLSDESQKDTKLVCVRVGEESETRGHASKGEGKGVR